MINTGTFGQVIDAVAAQAPDQVGAVETLARSVASFSFADFGIAFIERIFAVMLHVGASILVFYACKDKKKFFLYPLAVLIHTAVDFIAALCALKVITLPTAALEIIAALFGILTFLFAYLLLYRKDEKL